MNSNAKSALLDYAPQRSGAGSRPIGISLRLSERKLLLCVFDLAILNLALVVTLFLRQELPIGGPMLGYNLMWFLSLSCLWLAVGTIFDIYNLSKAARAMPSMWAVILTVLIATGSYLVIPYITPSLPSSRLDAFVLAAMAVVGIPAWRLLYAYLIIQPIFEQRVLIVGAGGAGAELVRTINQTGNSINNTSHGTGYRLLGFIDDDPAKQNTLVEGVPVLGTHRKVCDLVKQLQPDELIVAITHKDDINPALFQAILDCRGKGVKVTTMAVFYEQLTGQIAIEHAGQDLAVVLPTNEQYVERLYKLIRRLIDLIAGVTGCLALALMIPPIGLGNLLISPGSLFYSQDRVGQGGRVFRIRKFRSMVMNAEKLSGAVWAARNDPRITPMGRFLRKSRIDEIPQIINVLKGDMTLIGPRPERPEFVEKLAEKIPYYRARHAVKPGLTGWAQVKYRYGCSLTDSKIKLQFDLYYIKHQSLYLDLLIILKTIQVVLLFKGQ